MAFGAVILPFMTSLLIGFGGYVGGFAVLVYSIIYQVGLHTTLTPNDHWYYMGTILLSVIYSAIGGWVHYIITERYAGGREMVCFFTDSWRFTSMSNTIIIIVLLVVLWVMQIIHEFTWMFWFTPIIYGGIGFASLIVAIWMIYYSRDGMRDYIEDKYERKTLVRIFMCLVATTTVFYSLTYLSMLFRFVPSLVDNGNDYFVWLVSWGIQLVVVVGVTIYCYVWGNGFTMVRSKGGKSEKSRSEMYDGYD